MFVNLAKAKIFTININNPKEMGSLLECNHPSNLIEHMHIILNANIKLCRRIWATFCITITILAETMFSKVRYSG